MAGRHGISLSGAEPAARSCGSFRTRQGKTGAAVDIEITPEIDAVLARLKAPATKATGDQPASKIVSGLTLIHRRDGKPYTYDGLCAMLKRRQAAVREKHRAGTEGAAHGNAKLGLQPT